MPLIGVAQGYSNNNFLFRGALVTSVRACPHFGTAEQPRVSWKIVIAQ